MILFPDDVEAINELLEERAGLDPELAENCREHIELGQYADAVFKAFRVLEGRIQHRSGIAGDSASKTLGAALSPKGALTTRLGLNNAQAANLGNLLRGAFAFFRNPEAHPGEAVIEYGSAECQAVLAFVNLMLGVLDRQPGTPMDAALKQIRRDIGAEATERLAHFLKRLDDLNLERQKQDIGFAYRAWSLRATSKGAPPKKMRTTVFALRYTKGASRLSIGGQLSDVSGFDSTRCAERLRSLGFVKTKYHEHHLYLRKHNSAEVFAQLEVILRDMVRDLEEELENKSA